MRVLKARARIVPRLVVLAATLNLLGLACLCGAGVAPDPLARQSGDAAGDMNSVLGSIGFTLMMPGSFFGASAFLCAHVLAQSEVVARAVWYATAMLINLALAWKFGAAYEAARV